MRSQTFRSDLKRPRSPAKLIAAKPRAFAGRRSRSGGAIITVEVIAIFISNIPEGVSSAAGMKNAGRSTLYIFGVWLFAQSIQSETVGDYQFEIRGKKSELHVGQNPVEIRVTRAGAPAAVEKVSFELAMDMPGTPMRANAPLQNTAQPGVYRGSIKLDMQGEYNGLASVIGPAGEARKNFTVRVAQ